MKKNKILVVLFIIFLLSLPSAFGYWSNYSNPQPVKSKDFAIRIGRWYREVDDFDEGDSTDVTPGENYVPGKPYDKGSVVLGPDGILYEILIEIEQGEKIDFERPNKDWTKPMVWAEDTIHYRWYHRYSYGDYVWFNGYIYKYVSLNPHKPNTLSEKTPGSGSWEYAPYAPSNVWVRTKVYMEGDIVSYSKATQNKFKQYICIKNFSVEEHPDKSAEYWEELDENAQLSVNSETLETESLMDFEMDKDFRPEDNVLGNSLENEFKSLDDYLEQSQSLEDEINDTKDDLLEDIPDLGYWEEIFGPNWSWEEDQWFPDDSSEEEKEEVSDQPLEDESLPDDSKLEENSEEEKEEPEEQDETAGNDLENSDQDGLEEGEDSTDSPADSVEEENVDSENIDQEEDSEEDLEEEPEENIEDTNYNPDSNLEEGENPEENLEEDSEENPQEDPTGESNSSIEEEEAEDQDQADQTDKTNDSEQVNVKKAELKNLLTNLERKYGNFLEEHKALIGQARNLLTEENPNLEGLQQIINQLNKILNEFEFQESNETTNP
ncbi:MAG: hypothetical protein Q4E36_04955 [Bacillota bacterium]|nr:hypothetical protein [Bacillota bacterium]